MTDPGGPPLSRMQFDRVAHRRTDEAWLADTWQHARVLRISPKSATPVDDRGRAVFADAAQLPDLPRRFLGMVDDVAYFAVTVEADADNWRTLREIGADADDLEAGLLVSAIALEQWHQRHTYCPQCGAPTVEAHAGWVRECTNDKSLHFPRTDPAVIMLVHDGGDRALLGRGHQWAEGRFSTLAGFVEPGESIEAAVAREVYEEVGVAVRDIRYVASQPWPFPASLMLGFTARLDGGAAITLDPVEMAEAHWFTRDEIRHAAQWVDAHGGAADPDLRRRLRGISPHLSISRYLIDSWLDGKIGKKRWPRVAPADRVPLVPDDYFGEPHASRYDEFGAAMFAPAAVDPVVELLAELAGEGSALELGIGTGRIALPLRARGVPVHGIDLSAAMLAQLSRKPGAERIGVTQGDFATTRAPGSYRLAYLVFNTIMNLTSQDEQVACFRNVADHLEPGGRFVIEVGVPDLQRLPPGETVRPFEVSADRLGFDEYDIATQRLVSHHVTFAGDRARRLSIPFRYVWPAELDLMARLAGMTLQERWAGWHREPFTSQSRRHVSVWRKAS